MVFRLLPAAVLNASGFLFFGSFLVMAKNSGGYFSITNFFDGLARSARVLALSVWLSAYRLPLSRRSCRLCGVLCCGAGVCLSALLSRLVGLFLPVLRGCVAAVSPCVCLWRDILPAVARFGGRSYVFPPALLSFVYGRFSAFCGVASDCIKKTPHGGGVVVRCLFEIFMNRAEKFRYNGEYYIYYHRRHLLAFSFNCSSVRAQNSLKRRSAFSRSPYLSRHTPAASVRVTVKRIASKSKVILTDKPARPS